MLATVTPPRTGLAAVAETLLLTCPCPPAAQHDFPAARLVTCVVNAKADMFPTSYGRTHTTCFKALLLCV